MGFGFEGFRFLRVCWVSLCDCLVVPTYNSCVLRRALCFFIIIKFYYLSNVSKCLP